MRRIGATHILDLADGDAHAGSIHDQFQARANQHLGPGDLVLLHGDAVGLDLPIGVLHDEGDLVGISGEYASRRHRSQQQEKANSKQRAYA